MNFTKILTGLIAISSVLNAQSLDQTSIDRTTKKPPLSSSTSSGSSRSVKSSDSGSQRPVLLKTDFLSAFAGYDSKITYRSNPLTLPGGSTQSKTGIWQNNFFGGASISPIETDVAVLTPFVGAGWTMSDYLNEDLSTLNDYSTSAYALLMAQHESGWGFRGGVSYANVRNNDTDSEDYAEFYPNLGAMTTHGIGPDTIGIIDLSWGVHLTKSDSLLGSNTQSLNNWDAAFSYSIRHSYADFTFIPNYRLAYKKFTEGNTINDGRKDVSHTIALKTEYPFTDYFKIAADTSYTKRNSDGGAGTDYKSFDAGLSLGLNINF